MALSNTAIKMAIQASKIKANGNVFKAFEILFALENEMFEP